MTAVCTSQNLPIKPSNTVATIVKGAASQFASLAKERYQRQKQIRVNRQAFSHMLKLDNHILADIGLSRDDVIWASRLPIDVNAACELETIRKQARAR